MNILRRTCLRSGLLLPALIVMLSGCAAERTHRKGLDAIEEGHYEQGIELLQKATNMKPGDTRMRIDWLAQRQRLVEMLLANGDAAATAKRWDDAANHYGRVLKMDSSNTRAKQGLATVEAGRRHDTTIAKAKTLLEQGDIDGSQTNLRQVLLEQPRHSDARNLLRQVEDKKASKNLRPKDLNALYKGPITLEFRDANLKMALEALSRTTGINFVLDRDVRSDLQTTIFVKDATLSDTLKLMLTTSRLLSKVLNEKTVLIYPNSPNKIAEYQDLIVRSFYLTNTDARRTMEFIKTFVKTKEITIDERLNMLVMRDTPEAIELAEKLIALHDLADPEVMLEVAVLEIQSSKLQDLGIKYPEQVVFSIPKSGAPNLTVESIQHISGSDIAVSGLSATINLKRELSDGNVLANPRIRARNREKAKIKIGDRVPIITTTQNTTSNSTSDSVQYMDVGLNVEVEPDIRLDDELAIKLNLEVSSVIKEVRGGGGALAYQIGTRNINTVLRLKDGETQILGGLIRDDERQVDSRLPGLGDLPVAGRLFSNQHNEKTKTEIVLSITPHLIRNIERPGTELVQFPSANDSVTDGAGSNYSSSAPPYSNFGGR